MNVADTDMVTGILSDAGCQLTTNAGDADVILINTCAVRDKAEERVYARAQELNSHRRQRKNLVLAITGCMAEHLKEGLLKRAPYVDVIAGPDSYRGMPALIEEAASRRTSGTPAPVIDVKLNRDENYEGLSAATGGDGVSGFVSIQRGCDKFCTFCVVPFTRGRERGTPPREVLRRVRAFADAGYPEVVLLGQTVNSYRYADTTFAELLRAVARIDGIQRVRFTSPYPVDFDDDVIAAIAETPEVCNYVHLPVQSGSDAVLQRMRRGYTVADFQRIVSKLRSSVPDIAISTDILSSFCGETEADHQATLSLMRNIRFDSAFMFVYSEREPTFAAKRLTNDVAEPVRKRRIHEIIELQQQISRTVYASAVGSTQRVLLHSKAKRNPEQLVGRTDGFKAVIVDKSAGVPGDFVNVTIRNSTMATLFGDVEGTTTRFEVAQ